MRKKTDCRARIRAIFHHNVDLCSQPVRGIKRKCLQDRLMNLLEKADRCGFEIAPIIFIFLQ